MIHGFFKLITPFIDPHTREKLKFNEDMSQYVPTEQLWANFKGDLEFEYDHSVYWPALTKLAAERHEARRQRWIAGGKHIGESEDYLSGHAPTGVAPVPAAAEAETKDADPAVTGEPNEPSADAKSEAAKEETEKEHTTTTN